MRGGREGQIWSTRFLEGGNEIWRRDAAREEPREEVMVLGSRAILLSLGS